MLHDQITKDYIQAMKDKNTQKSSALNFLRAQLKNIAIEKKVEKLEDSDVIAVLKKQVKQRQDSIEQYKNGGRQDLVDKATAEMGILKGYLPAEMSEAELEAIITQVIKDTGASSMKDMGAVMKGVSEKTQGRADNRTVSELVKQKISAL